MSYLIFKEHPVAFGSLGQGCVFYAFLFSRQVICFKVFLFGDFLTALPFRLLSAVLSRFCLSGFVVTTVAHYREADLKCKPFLKEKDRMPIF
ncbi:hypothetical protein [Shewanella litorisediminis]|uniref:Uncharacterized protein n=1 Tax=Shewanella litorisediminis TaxID=1173586 RepID=A0ABX7G436_9GAMM|nr:hypothetical protein [Shewanella litorisediminis]MCL2920042.1 hypothetical protein [Shewanella litorisediminis]QRH02087.1 hypothetical protein JQC75_01210 [Shewanella litorisediminis]